MYYLTSSIISVIHMTMKDKYITYKVQDYKSAFFATMLLGKLCVRVEILLVFGEYFHDHTISIRKEGPT